MKNKGAICFLLFFLAFCEVYAQNKDSIAIEEEDFLFDSDFILHNEATQIKQMGDSIQVDLGMINIYGLPKFNTELDRRQYLWLQKKVHNLYPYLLVAVDQYKNLQDSMQVNNNNKDFKRYIKKRQKQLSGEYETKLRNLTRTEGQIFSKLMYRSTGNTVYEIIKELRNGWSAFWWNAKAGAFDIDLKEPYDPGHNRDDAYIESILLRAYQLGELKPLKRWDE